MDEPDEFDGRLRRRAIGGCGVEVLGVTMRPRWTRRDLARRLLSLSAAICCAPLSAAGSGRAAEASARRATNRAVAEFQTIDGWVIHVAQLPVDAS